MIILFLILFFNFVLLIEDEVNTKISLFHMYIDNNDNNNNNTVQKEMVDAHLIYYHQYNSNI